MMEEFHSFYQKKHKQYYDLLLRMNVLNEESGTIDNEQWVMNNMPDEPISLMTLLFIDNCQLIIDLGDGNLLAQVHILNGVEQSHTFVHGLLKCLSA